MKEYADGCPSLAPYLIPVSFPACLLQAGGQRLVQVLVYLNTLGVEQGDGTHFCHPLLQGRTVQVGRRQLCTWGQGLVLVPASCLAGPKPCRAGCLQLEKHPTLRPACVPTHLQPHQGDALIFFPAFADGCFDGRMAHSGQAVLVGQKWTVNTWACQRRVPTALAQLPAEHRQLERLARQQ
jgi:hypothetical protein